MDTLIDNRNFPPEMQQKESKPIKEKKASSASLILSLLVLIIVVFLVYVLFLKTPTQETSVTIEDQTRNVLIIQEQTPDITIEERDLIVEAFFN